MIMSMGELLVDLIVTDGAPSLDLANTFVARSGGAPANVTVALARLGVPTAFCGVAGADPFGARLDRELSAEGVDTSRLRRTADAATAMAFAWKDSRGDGHFWILRGADTRLSPADAEAAGIANLAALVIGSVSMSAQPSRSAIEQAVTLANDAGVPVVFDVNLRPTVWPSLNLARDCCEQIMARSRLVKLSLDDAKGILGVATSAEQAIREVLVRGPHLVVLTDGDRGCWFASAARTEATFVPAFKVEAIEPTGAGDAFLAGIIARLQESGWNEVTPADARFAAAAGALATTRPGAWDGLPTRQQLDEFLGKQGASA
jgi:fructokinase